jgi:hypothetical protein
MKRVSRTLPSDLTLSAIACVALAALTGSRIFATSASAVQWTNIVNATATGATIQKTGGCTTCADAGGTSSVAITNGDGYIEFTPAAGVRLYAGLGLDTSSNTDPARIDFAFSFWPDGGWDIRERNIYRTEGRFAGGDVFRVAVENGAIRYYKNTSLVYTSTVPAVWPLVFDTSLVDLGATVANATITGTAATSVSIDTTSVPAARIGASYSAALHATGGSGTYVWSIGIGSLPPGVALDTVTGTISGAPTQTGRFPFTAHVVDASNAADTSDEALELDVLAAAASSTYDAISDRTVRTKGAPASLGTAGFIFADPVFGSRMARLTDRATRPGALDRSYRTPSGTHTNAWSADGQYLYTVSTDGTVIPFAFDAGTMTARRLQPSTTGDGGLTLKFFNEPTFSYLVPGLIYGTYNGSGSNLHSIDQYDFGSGQYARLLDLESIVSGLSGTYVGGLGASAGTTEKIIAFFGGTGQDQHYLLIVFEKNNPASRHLVDTIASTVDGRATDTLLDFKIHAAAIDRSGRYVTIYPTAADTQAPRSAAPAYVWDTVSNTFTATPLVSARSGGHDAYGYGYRVNQDCCTSSTWDAAQWQFRSLATPLATADLVNPVLLPKEVYLADHPSWHNAQSDRLVPFVDATYRYGTNTTEWRAWDDEIIAVETESAGSGATVWRFAHHHSNVAYDTDGSRIYFWYTPRANVSPDGRWALFTSNWEKTLGTDPRGEVGGTYRQDLFLVELTSASDVPVAIVTSSLPDGRKGSPYSAILTATGGQAPLRWSISSGSLPPGLALDTATGVISGTPTVKGTWSFTVKVVDSAVNPTSDTRPLSLRVRRRL